jgi:hypothetical protein
MPLQRFISKHIDSFIAAIAGAAVILLFTRHGGIGMYPDSVVYSSTADNLSHTGKLVDFLQRPLIDFALLYPVFLSGFTKLTGFSILTFAPLLNAILFALLILLSGLILDTLALKTRWYKIAVLSCIVFSPCLLEIYSYLLSETLFLVLLLLFFTSFYKYIQNYSLKHLLLAALMAGLASITRYAGITIIATGGFILLLNPELVIKKKLLHIIIFSLVSSVFLAANLLRNYLLNMTLTGYREKSTTSFYHNIRDAGSVFSAWLPFTGNHTFVSVVIMLTILVALTAFIIQINVSLKTVRTYPGILAVFSLVYILFIIVMATLSRFEPLNSRFFSPVYIPLLVSGSSWMPATIQNKKRNIKTLWISFGLLILLLFQYSQLSADYETWDGVKDAGIPGYTEDSWIYGTTVQYIQQHRDDLQKMTVYSDAADAVYFFTGIKGKFLPHKEFTDEKKIFLNTSGCYVVWFNDGENPDLISKNFILSVKKMKVYKELDDGVIFISQ